MCPGPALTSLATAGQGPFLFVAMMALGAFAGRKVEERALKKGTSEATPSPSVARGLEDA